MKPPQQNDEWEDISVKVISQMTEQKGWRSEMKRTNQIKVEFLPIFLITTLA